MAKIRASRGDSAIPWPQWQRHDEAAEAYFRSKARGEAAFAPAGGGASGVRIKVKNNSGADRRAGEVLEFTGFALDDEWLEQGFLWTTGGSPTLVNDFGVLLRPTPNGDIDDCQIAGACMALVNVGDADHRFAVVSASTYILQSAAIGPVTIAYKPSGMGEKKCLVHIRGVTGEILVKNDTGSDIASGSSGTFKVFSGTPGSESDTGQTITAYNKSSVAFKNGKFGAASVLNGYAYACPWQT